MRGYTCLPGLLRRLWSASEPARHPELAHGFNDGRNVAPRLPSEGPSCQTAPVVVENWATGSIDAVEQDRQQQSGLGRVRAHQSVPREQPQLDDRVEAQPFMTFALSNSNACECHRPPTRIAPSNGSNGITRASREAGSTRPNPNSPSSQPDASTTTTVGDGRLARLWPLSRFNSSSTMSTVLSTQLSFLR